MRITGAADPAGTTRRLLGDLVLAAALLITITNPVASVSSIGDGIGVRGMRRRVAALGGEFDAGPSGDGRFAVHARLPIGGDL